MLDALNPEHPKYHDYYLWWNQGGRATLRSYLIHQDIKDPYEQAISQPFEYIPESHIYFLNELPLFWQTSRYFFVHGGIPPMRIADIDFEDPKVQEQLLWIRQEFYDQANKVDFGKKVIFAHTGFEQYQSGGKIGYEPKVFEHAIGINTMPRNEGKLTCIQLDDENDDYQFYFQPKL